MTTDKMIYDNDSDSVINKNVNDLINDSQYTLDGLRLWLNNKPKQSQEHFKLKIDSTPIFAGYTFTLCMVSKYYVCFFFSCSLEKILQFFVCEMKKK